MRTRYSARTVRQGRESPPGYLRCRVRDNCRTPECLWRRRLVAPAAGLFRRARRQRPQLTAAARVVRSHIGNIRRRERLRDRRHESILPLRCSKVAHLLFKIFCGLAVDSGECAGAVGGATEAVALRASRGAGDALRGDHGTTVGIGRRSRPSRAKGGDPNDRRGDARSTDPRHAGTSGPGDFRYRFLMASTAQ